MQTASRTAHNAVRRAVSGGSPVDRSVVSVSAPRSSAVRKEPTRRKILEVRQTALESQLSVVHALGASSLRVELGFGISGAALGMRSHCEDEF